MHINKFMHASVISSDLQKTKAFYEDLLGLQPSGSRPPMSFDGVWYDIGEQKLHILCVTNPETGVVRPVHGGRDRHIALGISDLTELQQRLQRAGVTFTLSSSGRAALFCRDPDDNTLEFIQVDR